MSDIVFQNNNEYPLGYSPKEKVEQVKRTYKKIPQYTLPPDSKERPCDYCSRTEPRLLESEDMFWYFDKTINKVNWCHLWCARKYEERLNQINNNAPKTIQ